MLDKPTYLDGLEMLARAMHEPDDYGRWLAAWNADPKRRAAYWQSLREIDPEIYRRAIRHLLPRIRRFPLIAEIIQAAKRVVEADLELPTNEQAWREVRDLSIRRHHHAHDGQRMRYVHYFHPDEPVPELVYSHRLIARVMDLMGGCETLEHGNLSYHKVRFDELWRKERTAMLDRSVRGHATMQVGVQPIVAKDSESSPLARCPKWRGERKSPEWTNRRAALD